MRVRQFLMFWRFHIALGVIALACAFQVMLFYCSNWPWKAFYVVNFVSGSFMFYRLFRFTRYLNRLRKQAKQPIPSGAIRFE